ncbi:MAG: hypothetical protein ACXVXC_12325 [Nocardioidaceae bacterium]
MRNPFARGSTVPAAVLARVPGRTLAGTVARDGSWLVGTREALFLVPPTGDAVRIPWEQVERADWDREAERLRVLEVGEFGHRRPEHVFAIEHPGPLLELVRERVTASVVLQRRVVLTGRSGFFVIARRPPAGGGEITWAYEFDAGVDPDEPGVREAAEQALRVAAEELGLG